MTGSAPRPSSGDANLANAVSRPAIAQRGPTLVEIRNLSKYYRRSEQIIPVLVDINLDIGLGEYVALMGPSGSGKSTLLNLIAGIDKASSGTIAVGGVDIASLSEGISRCGARRTSDSFSSSTT